MKRRIILARAVAVVALLLSVNVCTYADVWDYFPFDQEKVSIERIVYALDEETKTAQVHDGDKAIGEIQIPRTIRKGGKIYTVVEVGGAAFSDNKHIISVVLPTTITKIRGNAFSGCTRLTSVKLPNTITKIGRGAFQMCKSLKTIELPNKIKVIEENMFDSCVALESIIIPKSVEKIKKWAFCACFNLKKIKLLNPNTAFAKYAISEDFYPLIENWNGKEYDYER